MLEYGFPCWNILGLLVQFRPAGTILACWYNLGLLEYVVMCWNMLVQFSRAVFNVNILFRCTQPLKKIMVCKEENNSRNVPPGDFDLPFFLRSLVHTMSDEELFSWRAIK